MKITTSFRRVPQGLTLSLILLCGSNQLHAQPGQPATTAGKKAPKRTSVLKHAEEILGKPLTPTQKTAVRNAAKERAKAMKPIQEKFRASVAKALGMTTEQLETREKALRAKKAKPK